jgi:hypothetical protein
MPEGIEGQNEGAQSEVTSQDQGQHVQTEPSTAAAPASQGNAPWSNDLNTRFADETVRAQVDQYMRESVQPHVTQLEQKVSEYGKYENAHKLWDDLSADPQQTWLAVTAELYGDDVALALAERLGVGAEEESEETPDGVEPQLTREQQEALDWANSQRNAQLWQSEMSRVSQAHNFSDVDEELFAGCLVAANGDFDQAAQIYARQEQRLMERLGQNMPTATTEQEEAPTPPILGATQTGVTAPPVQKEYKSIADAVDDFLAEERANHASTVQVGSA